MNDLIQEMGLGLMKAADRFDPDRGERLDQFALRQQVAVELGVPMTEVEMMEARLSGPAHSLNTTQRLDEDGREWIDALENDGVQATTLFCG